MLMLDTQGMMGWDGMDVAADDDKETCVLWGAHDSGESLMQLDTIIEASWHTHKQLQQRQVLLETFQTKDMGGDTKGAQKDLMTNVLRNLVSKCQPESMLCCEWKYQSMDDSEVLWSSFFIPKMDGMETCSKITFVL